MTLEHSWDTTVERDGEDVPVVAFYEVSGRHLDIYRAETLDGKDVALSSDECMWIAQEIEEDAR